MRRQKNPKIYGLCLCNSHLKAQQESLGKCGVMNLLPYSVQFSGVRRGGGIRALLGLLWRSTLCTAFHMNSVSSFSDEHLLPDLVPPHLQRSPSFAASLQKLPKSQCQGAGLVTSVWRNAVLFPLLSHTATKEVTKQNPTLKSQCSQGSRIKYWTNKLWHSAGRKVVGNDGTTRWAVRNLLEVSSFMLLQSRRLLS